MDSYATVPNINITDCDFTIACWIKVVKHRGFRIRNSMIFSSIGASGNTLSLSLLGGIRLVLSQMFLSLNYTTAVVSTRKMPFEEWTHIAVSCHRNDIKMFFNGRQERTYRKNISYALNDDFSSNTAPDFYKSYYIAKDPRKEFFSSGKFYGSVMDLHVIGVALTDAEISDLSEGEICYYS